MTTVANVPLAVALEGEVARANRLLGHHSLAALSFVGADTRRLSFHVWNCELSNAGPLFGRLHFLHPAFIQLPLHFETGARLTAEPWPSTRLVELAGYDIASEYALTAFVLGYSPDLWIGSRQEPAAIWRPAYIVAAGIEVEFPDRTGQDAHDGTEHD